MSAGLLRTLKGRIKSVENTKKITRAMEMVAAAKLRRYQDMMLKAQPYAQGLESLLKRLSCGSEIAHPFLKKSDEKQIGLIFITSDTGLCGSYNLDLIDRASRFMKDHEAKGEVTPKLVNIGKMGFHALRRAGYTAEKSFIEIRASQVEETLKELKTYLEEIYLSGEVDAIYVIYSHCKSMTTFESVTEKLLPLSSTSHSENPERSEGAEESQSQRSFPPQSAADPTRILAGDSALKGSAQDDSNNEIDYLFEPDQATILNRLIPLFFESRTRQIFLEAFVSEHLARMNAMHQATKNASEMIDSLVLKRNKMRQAIITKELIEVVSGAQAQKS